LIPFEIEPKEYPTIENLVMTYPSSFHFANVSIIYNQSPPKPEKYLRYDSISSNINTIISLIPLVDAAGMDFEGWMSKTELLLNKPEMSLISP